MITYIGAFNLQLIIALCKKDAPLLLNKNNVDESEVPVSSEKGEVRYLQFLKVGDEWVYTGMRKA